ncbi:MAG: hypothetical protein ACXWEY_16620 [Bacteroidia bacterium]
MQHWNQHFNDVHNHQRIHGNENENFHQADFNSNDYFNMPYNQEGYGNPYHNVRPPQNQYNQQYYNQHPNQQQNMHLYRGMHTEQEWNDLANWADNNYRPAENIRHNENYRMNTPNYGETYNPQNRNYDPRFADDESGFSGDRRSANPDNEFDRDFGFENDNSYHHRNQQNNNFNRHEGQNRWHRNDNNAGHNRGRF